MKSILAKQGKSSILISELRSGVYQVENNNQLYKHLDCVMSKKQVIAWVKNLKQQGYMIAELTKVVK